MESRSFARDATQPGLHLRATLAAAFVRERLGTAPVALVLGTGLDGVVQSLTDAEMVSYRDIPFMPGTSVVGHAGKLVRGQLAGRPVFCLMGRVHGYEGHAASSLAFAVHMLRFLGCTTLILTNAAGGCQQGMVRGCLMAITSFVNTTRRNPLRDAVGEDRLGVRHLDATSCMSKRILALAKEVAKEEDIPFFEGVYMWTTGPTYETHQEVKAGMRLGGSAFGMSTVPEIVTGAALGMEVFAVSMVTNLAAGLVDEVLDHHDVKSTALEHGKTAARLLVGLAGKLDPKPAAEVSFDYGWPTRGPGFQRAEPSSPLPALAGMAAALRSVLGGTPRALVLAAGQHMQALEKRADSLGMALRLSDLAHFPAQSANGQTAVVRAATLGGAPVYLCGYEFLEGFSALESSVIGALAALCGCSAVLATILGSAVDSSKTGSAAALGDVVNWTCLYARHPLPAGARRWLDGSLHAALAKAAGETVAALALSGPSFPSVAENSLASQFGCQSTVTTSLAPLLAASSAGVQTAALVVHARDGAAGGDSGALLANAADSADRAAELVAKALAAADLAAAAPAADADRLARAPLVELPAQQTTQGTYEEMEGLCKSMAISKEASATTAVVVPRPAVADKLAAAGGFGDVAKTTEVDGSLSVREYSSGVVVVVAQRAVQDGDPAFEVALPARALGSLGLKRIVFATVGRGCTDSEPFSKGSLVALSDHVNFSGYNPLTGLNVDKWGTRFPDMSKPYAPEATDPLPTAASYYCVNTSEALESPATLAAASACGAAMAHIGATQQVIALAHMGIPSVCIAEMADSLDALGTSDKWGAVLKALVA